MDALCWRMSLLPSTQRLLLLCPPGLMSSCAFPQWNSSPRLSCGLLAFSRCESSSPGIPIFPLPISSCIFFACKHSSTLFLQHKCSHPLSDLSFSLSCFPVQEKQEVGQGEELVHQSKSLNSSSVLGVVWRTLSFNTHAVKCVDLKWLKIWDVFSYYWLLWIRLLETFL